MCFFWFCIYVCTLPTYLPFFPAGEQLLSFACVSKNCVQLDIVMVAWWNTKRKPEFGSLSWKCHLLFRIFPKKKIITILLWPDFRVCKYIMYVTHHYILQKLPDKLFKYVLEYVHRWHTFSSQHCAPFKNCTRTFKTYIL